jgi:hypothetical protein
MLLSDICEAFQREVEELDPDTHATRLPHLVAKLTKDAVALIADHNLGEIPGLCQRAQELLTALAAEAEDPEDRQCRYRSRAAMLNLLLLADGVARFHAATHAQQRASVDALRDLVAGALSSLIERDE